MNQWASKRINSGREREAKSIPCHVTKVDKDFITVAFETANGIFTPPTVKIPQSMSQYGRDPTQVGDKGYGVPGDYYLGGVTGDAGGSTNFYPRSNLTTLSFQPVSHKQNPDRDVDQLTHMGGPTGWLVGAFKKQKQDQQQNQQGNGQSAQSSQLRFQTEQFRYMQNKLRAKLSKESPSLLATTNGGSSTNGTSGQQQNGQDNDLTQFSFDKNGKGLVQSKDANHNLTVDQQNKTVSLTSSQTIFHYPGKGKVYLGGTDKSGGMARVMTENGLSKNTYAAV
jgi:hypothetical protein